MNLLNTTHRYGLLSITLHWFMVLLIAAVYACIELREFFPKGSPGRELLKTWHFTLGLTVLGLTAVRLLLTVLTPKPGIIPEPPHWQIVLARLMHVAFYAFLIAVPLGGWLLLSAKGKPIPFFIWELPPLIAQNRDWANLIDELHEAGGTMGYALIGAHALAALFHHYVVRDNTLLRMLPRRKTQD